MATETFQKVYGLVAEFPSALALKEAAAKVNATGFRRWDTFSPFPIHGMEYAMGLGKSWISALIFFGGIGGVLAAAGLQYVTSSIIYPVIINQKPNDLTGLPSFVVIMFQLMVIAAASAAIGGILLFNRMPRLYHSMFNWDRFTKVNEDGFFLMIHAEDAKFSETNTRTVLEGLGGTQITLVHE